MIHIGFLLPCGQCVGCRLERSRQWAMRIMHESQFYDDNCFITLTFDDEHLSLREEESPGNTLNVRDFQLFMKKLRKVFSDVRYFHCGEYGERFGRPHYHACLFNVSFSDRKFFSERNGYQLYTSDLLDSIWGNGFCTIGSLTFESAAYVARYIMKKVTGDRAKDHYQRFDIDEDTGEILNSFNLKSEYVTMSRRPGIGKNWFDLYHKRTYAWDNIIMNGHEVRPPKYYDSQFEILSPQEFSRIKDLRVTNSIKYADNNTPERLLVRENLQKRRLNFLPRNLDRS